MYSDLKNVQVLVSLLKKYGIKDIVISAGTRHTPLVYSVEHDPFFNCYSVVDERSASFFALGLIQELRKPVAICCTSGTATSNYLSAVNEAFYQHLPLLILTADRNPYYLNQQEEQMVPQVNLFKDVCKKAVTLPIVRDENDFWYCSRIVNEALLELDHNGKGPVHINFPIENNYPMYQGIVSFKTETLPDVNKIERISLKDSKSVWLSMVKELKNASKILIIYGQNSPISEEERVVIEQFSRKYNCVLAVDHLSNLKCEGTIETFSISRIMSNQDFERLCPEIVITMHGNYVSDIRGLLMKNSSKFKHWHVAEEGVVTDPFKCMRAIVECSPSHFFEYFEKNGGDELEQNEYYNSWKTEINRVNIPELPYSDFYAVQQFMHAIPKNSLLHIANSSSVRLAQHFPLDESITVYCNRGTNGIDGSMSAFIGQSHVSNRLSFLLIGDLSFFYDMNALWNQYVGNNIRILVNNNEGGSIFHSYPSVKRVPTLNQHIAAEHSTSVKDWVVSRGFKYLSANNKEELDANLPILMQDESDCPIILEVFSKKEEDVKYMGQLYESNKPVTLKRATKKVIKSVLRME